MYLTQNSNTKLVENLSEKIKFYQTSILNRIIKAPRRLLYSIGISYFARYFPLIVSAKAQTFFGESIKVILPEKVSTTLYRYGYFEEGLARFCLQTIKPGMTCLDIGTHFGFFSLLFAHLTSKNGQVHCFEPTKSTFKILQENTKNKQNMIFNNQAVWSENKTILFNDYGITDSAYNSIYAARWIDGSSKSSYKVETISIDTYLEKTGIIPHFIKIDAESAEH
jgi:FkbM family methyltransferase